MQYDQSVRNQNELEEIRMDVAEAEDTNSRSQRTTLHEELRQRDAWLRKPWGRSSQIVVEFQ